MLDFKDCEQCGNSFMPRRKWQKYCSQFCNQAAYYARKTPPSISDLNPTQTPTPTQEAEYERRKALPSESKPNTPQDVDRITEALKILDEIEEKRPSWEDLGYGKKS